MGDHSVNTVFNKKDYLHFIRHLLEDLRALEIMIEEGRIESGITRIGAEQEFCIIDDQFSPSNYGHPILQAINDPHFTTELAKYNLELNLDPLSFSGNCFTVLEQQLNRHLDLAISSAKSFDKNILLTGILPTINMAQLSLDSMTESPRYSALNDAMLRLRRSDFFLYIQGAEELALNHPSIMFEACNTSFQMHLQVDPEDFIASYNWAQAISAPVLSVSTNSPLLLGRELWHETRIALFQQSTDNRSTSYALKDKAPRVFFGDGWAKDSIAEIFKKNIARHPAILVKAVDEKALELLNNNQYPKLKAVNLHNGSTYAWNRPCYGATSEGAHVRIESRYIPSGPSIVDQIANFAFWAGLLKGRPPGFDHMKEKMYFRDAKSNFIKAARYGKEAMLTWEGKSVSPEKLIRDQLLPIAEDGLKKSGIADTDIHRLLEIIEKRTSGLSGSQWMIKNFRAISRKYKRQRALHILTKAIHENQTAGIPVHEWPSVNYTPKIPNSRYLARHFMSTYLFVVNENESATLAKKIMEWEKIHHLPVENDNGEICGIITSKSFENISSETIENALASDVMTGNVITTGPDAPIEEIKETLKQNNIGCIPVMQSEELIGIITLVDLADQR